jgi:hypothetical protein
MSTATDMLAQYLAAESALLLGKDVSFNGRRLTMEDLAEIRTGRQEWEARVAAESASAAGAPRMGGLAFSVGRLTSHE